MFGRSNRERKGNRGEVLPERNEGLPDSRTRNGLCPRCGKLSNFRYKGDLPLTFDYERHTINNQGQPVYDAIDRVTSLFCMHCNHGLAVVEEQWIGDKPAREGGNSGSVTYRGVHWWPLPEANPSSDIPADIANALAEASTCFSAHCYRASVVMSRRTLEAITSDQGETSGRLVDRLSNLSSKNVLNPTLSDWAKEVRLVGNTGGHFDPMSPVSKDDAEQILSFTRELIKYLYELPAELQRRRQSSP